jgi:hypothetical protein
VFYAGVSTLTLLAHTAAVNPSVLIPASSDRRLYPWESGGAMAVPDRRSAHHCESSIPEETASVRGWGAINKLPRCPAPLP